jgi:type II secretory pathway predicted ATPase ExeA
MYEACFGLNQRPFASVPQVSHYFPTEAIESARLTLGRCVERGEGAGMVVGPSGTGKTLLCRMLAKQFCDQSCDQSCNTMAVAMLSSGQLGTRRALLQAILYELGRPYRGMDEGELRLALTDYLTGCQMRPEGMVLLVDEAHTMPLRLFEEIRMLTNLTDDRAPRVRLVLAGGPLLEERFTNPKLESFSQRLTARCYLEPFTCGETQQYVQARIGAAGGQARQVFPDEACEAVYRATCGVPRLVNQLCDHAMLLAYAAGQSRLEPHRIDEAWADLQQLPMPTCDNDTAGDENSGVIEFGGLDDEPGELENELDDAPSLRVASDDEEQIAEPAERVEQIEQTLAELEEDFEPAGSIGPEVELTFGQPANPFDEEFEHEEEVVTDRRGNPNRSAAAVSDEPIGNDVVLLEEDHREDTVPQTPRVIPTPKREYRQLFAKLRRG